MATSEAIPNFEFHKVLDKLLVGQGAYGKIFKGKWVRVRVRVRH